MPVTWKRVKPLNAPNLVDTFLSKYNITISASLKACIIENNGGRPVPNCATAVDGQSYDVKHFLSFNKTDAENIYMSIDYFIRKYQGTLVPFAIDSGSNYFCEKNGRVVIWTQEDESIYEVSESFGSFIESLQNIS